MQSTLQEIREVIVLAAGASRRMGELTTNKPKSLLPYKGEIILERLVRQLRKAGVTKIILTVGYKKDKVKELLHSIDRGDLVIVENDIYEEDVNIHSMKLALAAANDSVCVFEADTIMEDAFVNYVTGADFQGKSVWFTKGRFRPGQYGGILSSDDRGNITDIKIVPAYADQYKSYAKLTGLMRIHKHELFIFKKLVDEYAAGTIKQYYLVPWIERLSQLPCVEGNAEHYEFQTFNRPDEYLGILNMELDKPNLTNQQTELVDVKTLKHIEDFDEERVLNLIRKIQDERVWTMPLYIERKHNLVLDGQHRLQAALRMNLRVVPVQKFSYDEVKVWTLRKEEIVTIDEVINRANAGKLYPYKSVKHKFSNVINSCRIPLDELRNPET